MKLNGKYVRRSSFEIVKEQLVEYKRSPLSFRLDMICEYACIALKDMGMPVNKANVKYLVIRIDGMSKARVKGLI